MFYLAFIEDLRSPGISLILTLGSPLSSIILSSGLGTIGVPSGGQNIICMFGEY